MNSRWSKGRPLKAAPTSGPPVKIATSCSSQASFTSSAITSDTAGVNSEGLIMQRLPAPRMSARGPNVKLTGKFHGLMTPTTPKGWYSMRERPPNSPSGNIVLRFSGRIQPRTCLIALLKGPMLPATSVIIDNSRGRQLKSVLSASTNLS